MEATKKNIPVGAYRALLVVATMVWGLGFGIGKYAIGIVGATWFPCIRFVFSGLVLLVVLLPHFRKHIDRNTLRAGIIIGVFSFFGFWTQFIGLGLTTASKNAFLSTCYCITVPFIWWAIARRRPAKRIFIAATICTVGIGFVSLQEGFTISAGDAMSILSAFAYGAEIVAIGIVMRDNDVFTVTIVQQLTAGVLAGLFALFVDPLPNAELFTNPLLIGALAYIVLLSASFGAIAQNLAQAHIPPAEAGILCSLESVFCAISSVLLFGEVFTVQLVFGFALIFFAVLLSQREGA